LAGGKRTLYSIAEKDACHMKHVVSLLHIDTKTGKSVYSKVGGKAKEVVFPQPLDDFLNNAAPDSIVSIHNHPSSGSYSAADLNVLSRYKSISHLIVVGHNRTRYVVKVGQGQRPTRTDISWEWKLSHDRYFNYFNIKVISGELTPDEAWYEHSHLIMQDVANKFGWEYRRVMPNER
jgi:hypothetical protein